MPHDESAAAAAPPPPAALATLPETETETETEPTWSRRDDKFLELLLFTRNAVCIHAASNVIGKTPAQMHQRCNFLFAELRHVLEDLDVETPREWDMEIAAATTAAPAPAPAEEEQVPEAVVPAADAPPVAAAPEDSDAMPPPVVAGGGERPEEGRVRKKKKAVKWTEEEHKHFLAGLDHYKGNWKAMSREYLPTKSASQIASHHQKYRIREKQRERDECKRASIHDITEPASSTAAAAAVAGREAAGWEDELPRPGTSAPGEEDEQRGPVENLVESGEPTREDHGLGLVEEFPGADDPGTLLTYLLGGESQAFMDEWLYR